MVHRWTSAARSSIGIVSLALVIALFSAATGRANVRQSGGDADAQAIAPPKEMGQAVFAAVSEIVAMLQDDPTTDWSTVDIAALREHLVDMDRVMSDVHVAQSPIEAGVEMTVTGSTDAVDAARRMVAAHAAMGGGGSGTVSVADVGQGLGVSWTTTVASDVAKVRALGFYGFLVEGNHHQQHHLMIATGRNPHGHAVR